MESQDAAVSFLVKIGTALQRYGTPAHQLEEALELIARRLGLDGHFFATPTALFVSFHGQDRPITSLGRLEAGDVDLEKMTLLDDLADRVIAGEISPAEGAEQVDHIVAAPARYGPALTAVCFGVASATTARFAGGGWREVVVASSIGVAVGLYAVVAGRRVAVARVFEPAAGAFATVAAVAAAHLMPPVSVYVTTLAGLIVLIPGLTLTVAVTELATRNLVSGTARLVGAALIFLELGFGVVVGGQLAAALPHVSLAAEPIPLPGWTEALALVVSPFVLAVIFKARPRDIGWIALAATVSFGGARVGTGLLGPQFGVCIGALLLGVSSNLYARWLDRPAGVQLVPGLMLIVPGSIGFGSVQSFLSNNVVTGVDAAFRAVMIAVALVMGLLLANAVVPPRRVL
jgi:uncharacterized membrane protein YjjP (DUF1212 family)